MKLRYQTEKPNPVEAGIPLAVREFGIWMCYWPGLTLNEYQAEATKRGLALHDDGLIEILELSNDPHPIS